jgi:hypothetical protein
MSTFVKHPEHPFPLTVDQPVGEVIHQYVLCGWLVADTKSVNWSNVAYLKVELQKGGVSIHLSDLPWDSHPDPVVPVEPLSAPRVEMAAWCSGDNEWTDYDKAPTEETDELWPYEIVLDGETETHDNVLRKDHGLD